MPEEPVPIHPIVRGAFQTMSSAYIGRFIHLSATLLLMHRLSSEAFGQVDFAISLLAMVVAVRNLGLHFALLHEHDRVDELAPTHLVLITGLGALGTVVAIGLSLFYVSEWHGETVASILLIFALFDLLRIATVTSEIQLRRDLAFGRLALSHVSGTVTAAMVAIAVGFLGGGIWALVFGHSVNSIGYVLVYCTLLRYYRPLPWKRLREFDATAARKLIRYGLWFWLGGIAQTLILQYDKLIVGTMISTEVLGFYGRAQFFAQMPTGAITHALLNVTGTVYARYQQHRIRLSAAYRRTLRLIVRTTMPISLLLIIEAPGLTRMFAGDDWLPMVPILRWLIVYSLCRPVLDDVHALLLGVGAPRSIAVFTSVQAGLLLIATPLLIHYFDLIGGLLSVNLAALIGVVLAFRYASRYVDVPWARALLPPLLSAGVAFAVRSALSSPISNLSALPAVAAGSTVLLLSYAATLLALERQTLLEEFQTLWTALRSKRESL